MQPLALLKYLARAAARDPDGAGVVDLAGEVMRGWKWAADAAARRAEIEQISRMPADEFRRRVEAAVLEAAGDQPAEVRERVTDYLLLVPDAVRGRLRPAGTEPPPDFPIDTPADLALLLPPVPARPPEFPPGAEPPRVVIRYTAGALAGREVVFVEPAVLLFGRADDCDPQFPGDGHRRVSRRHCFLEVNPPAARVRDLGSLHGTFVDGNLIGKRPKGRPAAPGYESPDHDLRDGAEVRLSDRGEVAFTVRAHAPAPPAGECAQCGREVSGAGPGPDRAGEFVCPDCRAEVGTVMRAASAAARRGDPDLAALRDYDVLDEIGHGGMGAVYRARHARTGTVVAVKVVLPKVAAHARAVALFRREIRNTLALNHPNVVRCLDHGFSRGAFFLVLEYCDGGTVADLMARRGRLPAGEAVGLALQALDGLAYAHRAPIPFVRARDGGYAAGEGLVHRDVKPANLFLAGSGAGRAVRVGDYGMAKAFEDAGLSAGTRTGDYGGTPAYMCRRQVMGYKTAGPEVDVWSLAACLYAMLVGRPPRVFPRDRDPWLVIMGDDPVPIRRHDPDLPERLAGVIDAALREAPEMAFRSAAEFKRALEEVG